MADKNDIDKLFDELVQKQAPIRIERLREIMVLADAGSQLALDICHVLRAWLGSQWALTDILSEYAAAEIRIAELERVLGMVEWIGVNFFDDKLMCPFCGNYETNGHRFDCSRQIALGLQVSPEPVQSGDNNKDAQP